MVLGGSFAVYAGIRTEVAFSRMTICIVSDVIGGENRVAVNGAISLDNGTQSRVIAYDIYPQLTAGQKTQLRQDFLAVLKIASVREDVPTPVPTVTP